MGYHTIEELLLKSKNSIYRLVRMAASRSMELADGKPKLVTHVSTDKLTTIALDEIQEGKVELAEKTSLKGET